MRRKDEDFDYQNGLPEPRRRLSRAQMMFGSRSGIPRAFVVPAVTNGDVAPSTAPTIGEMLAGGCMLYRLPNRPRS